MKPPLFLAAIVVLMTASTGYPVIDSIDLAGTWRFALDRDDAGISGNWASRVLDDRIQLPGIVTAQGFGDPVGMETPWTGQLRSIWTEDPAYREWQTPDNFKMPFWLQPPLYYKGAAWFQRDIEIPAGWAGRRIVLFLERPHWGTQVFLDGEARDGGDSLGTPHEIDLGTGLAPGKHTLTIRVDNRMLVNVGPNSHSVSDHTQGNWNGIVGRIELRATPATWIEDVQVFPSVSDRSARIEVTLGGGESGDIEAVIENDRADSGLFRVSENTHATDGRATLTLSLGKDAKPWDEFSPHLYRLTTTLTTPSGRDVHTVRFGLREISTRGTQLMLNGKRIYLRGTLECAIYPREGHPPTDVESWRRIIRICKEHGLNHMRFHSWCPPEAAFAAADELGFYFHVEASTWPNQGAKIGSGLPLDGWIEREAAAMFRAYGNHPSFIMFCTGNEPGGPNHVAWLNDFVDRIKQVDTRRLYTSAAGWPFVDANQYHVLPGARIQHWGEGLNSIINSEPPTTEFDYREWVAKYPHTPIVSHEIGQWCVYPNFDEIAKYDGFFKARNFEIFRETARRNGIYQQAADFLHASGRLQVLCYKASIEAALRTPGFGGFQLLSLYDFSGQGTALVGVLDAFWEQKGYITPDEFRTFCGPIVPLVRLPRMIYQAGETIRGEAELSQFGPAPVSGPALWRLTASNGADLAAGKLAAGKIFTPGNLHNLGTIEVRLPETLAAQKLRLELSLPGTGARNSWDLFVYPREVNASTPAGVLETRTLDRAAIAHLDSGGTVLWMPPANQIAPDPKYGPIEMGFSSIFWNTVWTDWQPPHTLGILCDPADPALAEFPTEVHSNWQWWEIQTGAKPFILTDHRQLRPIVQVIDDWVTNRKLGLVFEARVGRGRLLASSVDLTGDLSHFPVRRQLRASLLRYIGSSAFQPTETFSVNALRALVTEP